MSVLFTSMDIGTMRLRNRFVHSATHEGAASENGEVTEDLVRRYETLSRGEVGLIIPGYMFVHPLGRSAKLQTGIHDDATVPGLGRLVEAVHRHGGRIAFQLNHAGRQTTKALAGGTPIGPSRMGRDPAFFVKPREMKEDDIRAVIGAFGSAARRAIEAGADAIQLHAAHGYLINQFLSPFFNHRKDDWGGSDINRFRFLREVILEVRGRIPPQTPLLVKLNSNDYTPREGVIVPLATKYAKWLAELGVHGIEVSCGTGYYSPFAMIRGSVPVKEMASALPFWMRPLAKAGLGRMKGKYEAAEGYNVEAAEAMRLAAGETPLMVVGGFRTVARMEETVTKGGADCISMSRPFIREPLLVKNIREGRTEAASCISCNRCLAAVMHDLPVRCYVKGLPGRTRSTAARAEHAA